MCLVSLRPTPWDLVLWSAAFTEDGFHALSGINSYVGYECTGSGCTGSQAAASKTFTLGSTSISGSLVKPTAAAIIFMPLIGVDFAIQCI